jgi:hypothetical protein
MSQPVKLSDSLVLDARVAGEAMERSIAGQVEFWAKLGRAVEQLLQAPQVLALCRNAAARPLSECLETVDSKQGRRRVATFLQSQPFPHYEPHPKKPGLLVRINENGSQTVGRFINRQFQAVKARTSKTVTAQDSVLEYAVAQTKAVSEAVKQKPNVAGSPVETIANSILRRGVETAIATQKEILLKAAKASKNCIARC